MDSTLSLPKGIYHDRIITAQSHVVDFGWRSNIIVDRCRYLLAAFMKGDSPNGIQLLAVGRGLESWDQTPEPPSRTEQQLTNPAPSEIQIEPGQIEYLDATGVPTAGPTHRLQVTVTIEPGIPPIEDGEITYPLREFGLFGKFGDEEYMIDYVRHPVIHKGADDTLVRTIRLVF